MTYDRVQARAALKRANRIRSAAAAHKRALKLMRSADSWRAAAELVEHSYRLEGVGVIPVGKLLLACRGMGLVRSRKVLKAAKVSEICRVRGLAQHQRLRLALALRMEAEGYEFRVHGVIPGQVGFYDQERLVA